MGLATFHRTPVSHTWIAPVSSKDTSNPFSALVFFFFFPGRNRFSSLHPLPPFPGHLPTPAPKSQPSDRPLSILAPAQRTQPWPRSPTQPERPPPEQLWDLPFPPRPAPGPQPEPCPSSLSPAHNSSPSTPPAGPARPGPGPRPARAPGGQRPLRPPHRGALLQAFSVLAE